MKMKKKHQALYLSYKVRTESPARLGLSRFSQLYVERTMSLETPQSWEDWENWSLHVWDLKDNVSCSPEKPSMCRLTTFPDAKCLCWGRS